jgi:hypothetical protein
LTLDMIRQEIKRFFIWINDLSDSPAREHKTAVQKAIDALAEQGVTTSNRKIDYGAVPTINGGIHVESSFLIAFRLIREQFLKVYNAHLRKRGLNPIRLAV